MVYILNEKDSILNTFLAEIRDRMVQQDSMRFRRNLERVGEIMAYEISRSLVYTPHDVQTPIGTAVVRLPAEEIVVASVMRAGLPFHCGFLNYFDRAGNAFVAARRIQRDGRMEIRYDSVYTPDLTGKQLLLVDPMLATGSSIVKAYRELIREGNRPVHTHIASLIASRQGMDHVLRELEGEDMTLWTAALDEKLTENLYIDPGIGDAGDLAFGVKK